MLRRQKSSFNRQSSGIDGERAERVASVFRSCDVNCTGIISQEQLVKLLEVLDTSFWTKDRVEMIMAEIGKDGDGAIRYDELVDWLFDIKVKAKGPIEQAFTKALSTLPAEARPAEPAENLKSIQQPASAGQTGDPSRGLSVNFLAGPFLEMIGANANPSLTVYEAEPRIRELSAGICPRDGKQGCAFVDVAPDPEAGSADYMLSYGWVYRVSDIVEVLFTHCSTRCLSLKEVRVWICCLCVNQHRVKEQQARGEVVSFDEFQQVFGARVHHVKHVLAMMSPWRKPLYLERVWCIYELFISVRSGTDLVVLMPLAEQHAFRNAILAGELNQAFTALADVRIQDAKATKPADREGILKLIDDDATDYDSSPSVAAINAAVREKVQAWFLEVAAGHLEKQATEGMQNSPPLEAYNAVGSLVTELNADYPRARSIIETGLARCPAESLAHAEALRLLARIDLRMHKWYEQGKRLLEQAKRILEAHGGHGTLQHAQLLCDLGVTTGNISFFEESRLVYESVCATDSTDYARVLKHIGSAHRDHRRFQDAMQAYDLARAAYKASGASISPGYADLLSNIGELHGGDCDREAELRCYEEAERVYMSCGCVAGVGYGRLLCIIGDYHLEGCDYAVAQSVLLRAKAVYESACGATVTTNTIYQAILEGLDVAQAELASKG